DLEAAADPHLLAPLRPCRRGEQESHVVGEAELESLRSETAVRLSKFPGGTKTINGRLYFHLDDYRAWSERATDGDLQIIEGVVTQSWNAWVDAAGDQPELIGVPVHKLEVLVDEADFFPCNDPERQRRREESVSLIRMSMADRKEISDISRLLGECWIDIPQLL